jgi:hypothetical protein
MAVFHTLSYVLDLRDRSNCSRIERVRPGEEIEVLVRSIHDPEAPSLVAKGTLSQDGASFDVVITRTDGSQESYPLNYEHLKQALTY